jgi:hypothetical protein
MRSFHAVGAVIGAVLAIALAVYAAPSLTPLLEAGRCFGYGLAGILGALAGGTMAESLYATKNEDNNKAYSRNLQINSGEWNGERGHAVETENRTPPLLPSFRESVDRSNRFTSARGR